MWQVLLLAPTLLLHQLILSLASPHILLVLNVATLFFPGLPYQKRPGPL
jgi:hypothetical protein